MALYKCSQENKKKELNKGKENKQRKEILFLNLLNAFLNASLDIVVLFVYAFHDCPAK